MSVSLAHPPIHHLLAAHADVSPHDPLAVPAGRIFLVAIVLIGVVLLVRVIVLLSRALAFLALLIIGLILVIGVAAVGLSGVRIVLPAPATSKVVAPPLPLRPHSHTASSSGPTPSRTRPSRPAPSQSPRSSLLTSGARTFVVAHNRTLR